MWTSDRHWLIVVIIFGAVILGWHNVPTTVQSKTTSQLSSSFPGDVTKAATAADIDRFSWESFVAANWPTGSGVIGQGGDHAAVWQFWKTDSDVLVPAGSIPIPWKQPSPIPTDCTQSAPPGTRVLTHDTKMGKLGDFLTPGSGPLIDQNGEYVRFEILVNEPMYDFILANQLYSVKGQDAFDPGGTLALPSGTLNGAIGSIMIKVAWKILGVGDDPKRFHVAQAYLYNPSSSPKCQLKQVGMVGMHLSHKTQNAPQWVWSTFEHVDNAPLVKSGANGPFSFNDGAAKHQVAGCDSNGGCNKLPLGKWDPNTGVKTPVQVARLIDFTATAKIANTQFEAALLAVDKASVFANYRLVGTQFPSDPTNVNDPAGVLLPQLLANTTMETYLQGDSFNVSSSCGGCHIKAVMAGANGSRTSDFSFLLARVGMK